MNDVAVIESLSLRKQFCTEENTPVLEKVSQLISLPKIEFIAFVDAFLDKRS